MAQQKSPWPALAILGAWLATRKAFADQFSTQSDGHVQLNSRTPASLAQAGATEADAAECRCKVSFRYCRGGSTMTHFNTNRMSFHMYYEGGEGLSSALLQTEPNQPNSAWEDFETDVVVPPGTTKVRLVFRIEDADHVPDTGFNNIRFACGGVEKAAYTFDSGNDGFSSGYEQPWAASDSELPPLKPMGTPFEWSRGIAATTSGGNVLISAPGQGDGYVYYEGSHSWQEVTGSVSVLASPEISPACAQDANDEDEPPAPRLATAAAASLPFNTQHDSFSDFWKPDPAKSDKDGDGIGSEDTWPLPNPVSPTQRNDWRTEGDALSEGSPTMRLTYSIGLTQAACDRFRHVPHCGVSGLNSCKGTFELKSGVGYPCFWDTKIWPPACIAYHERPGSLVCTPGTCGRSTLKSPDKCW